MANEFIIRNGFQSRGDSQITGSLDVTGGITGSYTGSFTGDGSGLTGISVTTFPYTGSAEITGSLEVIGNTTITAGSEYTASFTDGGFNFYTEGGSPIVEISDLIYMYGAVAASDAGNTFSGSFSGDGSGLTGIVSSSYAVTASYADNALSAINTPNAVITASNTGNDDTIEFLKGGGGAFSVTVNNVVSSSYALTASYALNSPAGTDTNFANTDLTFTGFRTHDTNGNGFIIASDGAGTSGPYMGMTLLDLGMGATVSSSYIGVSSTNITTGNSLIQVIVENTSSITISPSQLNINSANKDHNVVIEGVTDTSLLVTDASTDRVGIGKSSPNTKLDVNGDTTITGSLNNGSGNTSSGNLSHAEGFQTIASGLASHAEGYLTIASGSYSHAEGYLTTASGDYSHAEGYLTIASGSYSHAEGFLTIASGSYSHAEGNRTIASGLASHAEGHRTIASGSYSHAEGYLTTASGSYSHAEGFLTTASGDYSHAEGNRTIASGLASHAEGYLTTASGDYSHAQGGATKALGDYSFSSGNNTIASGDFSFAHGAYCVATGSYQTAIGTANVLSDNDLSATGDLFIVGNGSILSRSNAFKVSGSGDCFAGGAFTGGGADYAEYFESHDGQAIPLGTIVELTGSYIKICENVDNAIGVISNKPSVLGNAEEGTADQWIGMYLKDEWGNYSYESYTYEDPLKVDENGDPIIQTGTRRVLNPDYDPSLPYIPRSSRPEWNVVGLLGQIRVLKNQNIPSRWIKMKDINDAIAIYLVK